MRADSSVAIGSGHVARCLALAGALRQLGAEVSFACRDLPGHRLAQIAAHGYGVFALPGAESVTSEADTDIEALLPWQADIAALATVLPANIQFDWIVVDHYGLDRHWELAARRWAAQVAAIDDLANRPHAVALLLDQNYNASPERYAPWLQGQCRSLLGPRYALLRQEFQAGPQPVGEVAQRVLVNFGGMDTSGQTLKAARALLPFAWLQVTLVAGQGNPYWAELMELAAGRPQWRLLAHSNEFAQLMAQADLFVGAGGGTSWERAALGLPTLCMAVANNQHANAQALAAAGIHGYLGPCEQVSVAELSAAIVALLNDVAMRQQYAERSRQLVDGRGAQRVAVALAGPLLQLTVATLADARTLFDGRNAEQVRRWSGHSEPLEWRAHLAWLSDTLADPRRCLLLAQVADGPVGVLRYDREDERAQVSIYLLEGRFGLGWGVVLLACGEHHIMQRWPEVKWLDARVLLDNQASINLFQAAGYLPHAEGFARALEPAGMPVGRTFKEQP